LLQIEFVGAHGGLLDSSGGHNDRKNGSYHYHNSTKSSPKTSPKKRYYKKEHRYSAPQQTVKSVSISKGKILDVRVIGFTQTVTPLQSLRMVKR
jgi:hypothetical protein